MSSSYTHLVYFFLIHLLNLTFRYKVVWVEHPVSFSIIFSVNSFQLRCFSYLHILLGLSLSFFSSSSLIYYLHLSIVFYSFNVVHSSQLPILYGLFSWYYLESFPVCLFAFLSVSKIPCEWYYRLRNFLTTAILTCLGISLLPNTVVFVALNSLPVFEILTFCSFSSVPLLFYYFLMIFILVHQCIFYF